MPSDMLQDLIEVMSEEQHVFRNLPASHQPQLRQLESKALTEWWRVERWFWQHARVDHEPLLWIGPADPRLPPNVEFVLRQIIQA